MLDKNEKCYRELADLWSKFAIAEDYKDTLLHKPGYEDWIESETIAEFIENNYYSIDETQNMVIEKYYGEDWDVTSEFPEWCRRFFGGYCFDDFVEYESDDTPVLIGGVNNVERRR